MGWATGVVGAVLLAVLSAPLQASTYTYIYSYTGGFYFASGGGGIDSVGDHVFASASVTSNAPNPSGTWSAFTLQAGPFQLYSGAVSTLDCCGTVTLTDGIVTAWLLRAQGTDANLNISILSTADAGDSVAVSGIDSHFYYAFGRAGTWTVVETPLPGALPLFASVLAGLGFIGWLKRRWLVKSDP